MACVITAISDGEVLCELTIKRAEFYKKGIESTIEFMESLRKSGEIFLATPEAQNVLVYSYQFGARMAHFSRFEAK